jgi:hypothetical protein
MKPLFFILLLFFAATLPAQQKINCIVVDINTGQPVPFATVLASKSKGLATDSLGKFSITVSRNSRQTDSIIISAVGYRIRQIALKEIQHNSKLFLFPEEKELEQVKVFASLKGDYRRFGYYRSWPVKNEGGEIGFIFDLPFKKFLLGSVQVKINHNYDTCWLKLHMRDVALSGLSLPENDLLNGEVILPVTTKYGLVEFNMNWQPVTLPTERVYVSFELLKCGCSESTAPSFFYMGNETGENLYRENATSVWKRSSEYTIYVRMLMK